MFLAKDVRHGSTSLVFTWVDPRKTGYKGDVKDNVTLDYDLEAVHSWADGEDMPEVCVGRDPSNPRHYKVFKYNRELQAVGYESVPGTPIVVGSWKDYVKLHLLPPDPEQIDDEDWYKYLDQLDEEARRRRRRVQEPEPPAGKSRDEVAAWIAKKHLLVDSGIREVWYLPHQAPDEEIRLLELNDRLAGTASGAEPIEFGLDIDGAQFQLLVADMTSEQLDQIKQDPSLLPPGWSLAGNRVWMRGA